MISDEKKARIEALSPEEMLREINLGRKSRFHGESFDHLKTCYQLREQAEEESRLSRQENRDLESLTVDREANAIATKALSRADAANDIAKDALRIARHERITTIIAAIAAIVAAIAAIISAVNSG